jgi:hypothetical protein
VNHRIDTAGSRLASAVTEDATTFTVETVRGSRWTTDHANMGFGIVIGDDLTEVMTVTRISGTSNHQTFTVTRGTWGEARSYGAAETVRLAHPTVLHIPDWRA